MSEHKQLVIVETPFQLLCANEYVKKKKIAPVLVVRKSGVGANDFQLDAMIRDLEMGSSIDLIVRPRHLGDLFKAIFKILPLMFFKYESVVIGSYFSNFQRKIAFLARKNNLVLLDDGVASVLADRLIGEIKMKAYSAFSIFPLTESNYKSFELNDFNVTAGRYDCYLQNDLSCFFIGQKLVDIDAVGLEAYVRVVEFCVSESGGEILNYIPHRAEGQECIERIKAIPGVRILFVDFAIEYYFLRERITPSKVFSVISTALYSVATIFPASSIYCVRPESLRVDMFVHYDDIINVFSGHPSGMVFLSVG
ncbi:hypothetical protein EQ826_19810 [Ectopseudomonas mendocina]|nr:hypothetical protein [Pseudomonas mendocina]TRO15859.1 hypothetical protein EQ828_20150 [Pseudomonas mendocina]TRO23043.1 hypothetical protein EQ826_19810 [Pseudomonas mendocina]